jgi:hypothetical protein
MVENSKKVLDQGRAIMLASCGATEQPDCFCELL